MRYKIILALFATALFSVAALAETKSDYDRNFDFSKLRTWDFKVVTRMPNDPIARNELWDRRIRDGLTGVACFFPVLCDATSCVAV